MSYRKILIVKPSSMGDVIHSLPVLNALGKTYPDAQIHWVIAKGLEGILEGSRLIKKLWVIDKDRWKNISRLKDTSKEIITLLRDLKAEGFDLVIDLQGLLRSGLIAWAAGQAAKERIGFKEAREASAIFYTTKIAGGSGIHAVDRYLKIASYLKCDASDIAFPLPDHKALSGDDHSEYIEKTFADKDYAVLIPGSKWKTKQWPAEYYGKLAKLLPFASLVIGSAQDRELALTACAAADGKAVDLTGKTSLRELIGIIKDAKIVITNDTGPMHIAAALETPCVCLFGPTDPALTGPYSDKSIVIKAKDWTEINSIKKPHCKLSPCFRKKCYHLSCMRDLSFAMVYEIILRNPKSKEWL
ncbi:ADP-heptose:LPS heptosyltransferase [Candidatus Magnetoovum chiemensis]|nr:ADP-heptose:LPS heptosyltransferase [Candidatus Magnetoovum chiemensis]